MKYITFLLGACLFISVIAGCKKEVQVGTPVTQLVTATVFGNDNTATAATLSIYSQMITDGVPWNLHRVTALSSDELTNFASDQSSMDLYTNALSAPADALSIYVWVPMYSYIYQANAILENLKNSENVTAKVKQQLNGESLFIRAYSYSYLVNLYGDVPLALSTHYQINAVLPRAKQADVYQQIISDLKSAQGLLNNDFVDASDTAVTPEHIRPTSWAASALLARIYLYAGKYDSAELQATHVINNPVFQLPLDPTKVFLKNSSEAIWQIADDSYSFWTSDGLNFILEAAPTTGNFNSATISPQLLNAFEPGDARKTAWIGSYTDGTTVWNFPYKYKDDYNATAVNEYTMMLRLAEQYLIRAEARAQQGSNIDGALADLNSIRNRAGLANYAGATDRSSLLAAIAHERQVELFTEADRWIDLKRTNTIDAVMGGPTGACAAKGGIWDTRQQLYPLLPADITNNSNLVQNPGY